MAVELSFRHRAAYIRWTLHTQFWRCTIRSRLFSIVSILMICLAVAIAGCDQGGAGRTGKTTKVKKDYGDASMMLGDTKWDDASANARFKDDGKTLKLSISKSQSVDGIYKRDSMNLTIKDYKGPGTYKIESPALAMFIGVGIDTKKASEAKTDDEVKKQATSILTGAKTMLLMGIEISVTKADDKEIHGTFKWEVGPKIGKPAITDGKFRAIVKK
jgi:hypothetical protein